MTRDDKLKSSISKIRWDNLTPDQILQYKLRTENELSKVRMEHKTILCDDPKCTNIAHHGAIDNMCRAITDALHSASEPLSVRKRTGFRAVPGWNEYCKEAHSAAREAYLVWRDNGRCRHGVLFENMKKTRAQFKRTLRICKKNDSKTQADRLACDLLRRDDKSFWREIKKINDSSVPLASTVNNVSGEAAIAGMWKNNFEKLLNSSKDTRNKDVLDKYLNEHDYNFDRFSVSEVLDAIMSLKNGKSAGKDNIFAEHYKFSHDKCAVLLTMLFNMIMIHGYIPQALMDTIITPILKDKKGCVTDSDNYRPVAITCISSKIFEKVMLNRYIDLLYTSCNQFGFKRKLGTDMCIYTFKQVIEYYKSFNNPVYVAFMDASKAFDKINHFHLLVKLLDRGIPIIVIRCLYYWFTHQEFVVRWGNAISSPFRVTNGVRQGGLASPVFFNVYMDLLSKRLSQAECGCTINDCRVNHILYADDSVLLAPTPRALQNLINICVTYADEYELTFNVKKTKVMCFVPNKVKNISVPEFYINGQPLQLVSSYKYLGVIIDSSYKDDSDIYRQMRGIYSRGNMLSSKFSKCSNDVKACLFKSYCSSLYCSQLWSRYTCASFNKLKSSYNRIVRHLFHLKGETSISQKCLEYGVECFNVVLRKSIFSFRSRLLQCDNMLVASITKSAFFMSCNLIHTWNKLLFTFDMS